MVALKSQQSPFKLIDKKHLPKRLCYAELSTSSLTNKKRRVCMNKRTSIVALAVFSIATVPLVKAFDPATILLGALVGAGINKAIDGAIHLLSPSKSDEEYTANHARFSACTKKDFLDKIEVARDHLEGGAFYFLTQHELYRYPNFIAALKETFPEHYAEYIKKLMQILKDTPNAVIVRGFETDHVYHKCKRFLQNDARDFSEFYELIKKLYAQVLAQEEETAALKAQNVILQTDLCPSETAVEKASDE